MATVFKRSGSPFYFACFPDRFGRQKRRSTKTSDRALALKLALEWEGVERMAKAGQATTAQFQKVVNQVAEKVIGESLPCPTVKDYFAEWLETVKRRATPSTVERYGHAVKRFMESLGAAADQQLRSLTPRHIEQFVNRRIDENVAPKTVIVDTKIIGAALRRAEIYGMIDLNPVPVVKLPKNVSSERGIFTAEKVQKILNAAPNRDWKTLILLGFYLGARLGDCVMMKWENVDEGNGLIVYEQRKTGGTVRIPMHFNLLKYFLQLPVAHAGFLCPSIASKTSGGKHGLSESFIRIVKRAGLDPMVVPGKGYRKFTRRSFHSLRHSFASALANVGVAEEVRMRLTGHVSRDMHAKYTHTSGDTLKNAINKLPFVS